MVCVTDAAEFAKQIWSPGGAAVYACEVCMGVVHNLELLPTPSLHRRITISKSRKRGWGQIQIKHILEKD